MTDFDCSGVKVTDGHLRCNSPRNQTIGMALPVPQFTIDMLDSFPEDGNRYELLEGMLLVTPSPSHAHQVVATRLIYVLMDALEASRKAQVVAVGAIQRGDNTQLEPDILVHPATFRPGEHWRDISGWWLAVEVMSPSSRIYDTVVKRDAYLALGVEEYWVMDMRDRSVEVWKRGSLGSERVTGTLTWRPAALDASVIVDLDDVFRDVGDGGEDDAPGG
ncbi:MAG: Uma2 family endonuclease [Gemmatimonadaceae bacterium]|nr:Uma2 family endonuclease [Gemmatimonadaceae bacterium]